MGNKKKKVVENDPAATFDFQPEIILRLVSLLHIIISPLTKVEESFNIQAVHDLLFHRTRIEKYDHLEFPGVVPRTFIGPLIVAVFSAPIVLLANFFFSKFFVQIIVRICLSEMVIRAFQKFRESISGQFGQSFGIWLTIITASQFHFMYYMGRTLPNTFALPAAFLALHYWIKMDHFMFIYVAAFDIIVFRAELALLFGMILLFELYHGRINFSKTLWYGSISGSFFLFLTVAIDSVFWKRLLWPEGEVFWFNTIMNQSHKWGTLPFLWYFYSAIPRALAFSTLLIPMGVWVNSRVRVLLLPSLLFVLVFSFLPHKELRFIFYIFPLLNVCAAAGCDHLWKNRGKGFVHALISVGVIFHIVLNGVYSTGFLHVSSKNYPGGNALLKLHHMEHVNSSLNIHIDVYSAQSGVTRFLEISPNWKYNKTEDLQPGGKEMLEFSHLLIGTMNTEDRFTYFKTHEVQFQVDGYSRIDFNYMRFPPILIKTEPKVLVLRRKDFTTT